MKNYAVLIFALIFIACDVVVLDNIVKYFDDTTVNIQLDKLQLPAGFEVSLYAEGVKNARSMCLSPEGTLYVGTRNEGNVYALKDTDGDMVVDKQYTLLTDATMPNGVAFKDGDLYVGELNRILKFENIESKLSNPGKPKVIFDGYPTKKHHGWKYIAFGPDGKLYVPVGAPCNICKSDEEVFASITRINTDGTGMEIVHEGIRNSVGFTWHPKTNELFFTDNGGDMLGDDLPACELNKASKDGLHFGYPYCHQGDTPDKDHGTDASCEKYTAPFQKLGPHVAPLGCKFYKGSNFPSKMDNTLFIAEHGSWNRSKKIGYRITTVALDENNNPDGYSNFITGWLDDASQEAWGRPVDLEWMPDGSMLISDDLANAIYRVKYTGG